MCSATKTDTSTQCTQHKHRQDKTLRRCNNVTMEIHFNDIILTFASTIRLQGCCNKLHHAWTSETDERWSRCDVIEIMLQSTLTSCSLQLVPPMSPATKVKFGMFVMWCDVMWCDVMWCGVRCDVLWVMQMTRCDANRQTTKAAHKNRASGRKTSTHINIQTMQTHPFDYANRFASSSIIQHTNNDT